MRMPLYLLSVLTACIAQQNSGDVSMQQLLTIP